jgi:hypothetical protein
MFAGCNPGWLQEKQYDGLAENILLGRREGTQIGGKIK